jgi:hypothetical protein
VYLKHDTATLATFATTPDPYFFHHADITWPFESGKIYSFVLETAPVNNAALHYTLNNYTHIYVSPFTTQLLSPLTQSMGPDMMDLSPSRKTIFVTDDVHNVLITKRISLADGRVDSVGVFNYGLLRAVSDNEVLTGSYTYNGHNLQQDSLALNRYNISTRQSSFVALISSNTRIVSRVIDNHILVAGPQPLANTQLINLTDTSKLNYPSSVDSRYISSYHFDHLYYNNHLVDPNTGAFLPIIPAADSNGIQTVDSATGYAIGGWYSTLYLTNYPPAGTSQGHLAVYSHGSPIYQGKNATSVSYSIPVQTRIVDNKLIFFQNFGFDTAFHVSGYYQLDLNTKTTTLLQNYGDGYVVTEFQLDPHTIISVRKDGVYRLTMP